MTDLPGWPRNRSLFGAAVFEGWLYGLVGGDDGTSVWRTDGRRSERVAAPRAGWGAAGLAAGEDGLWAAGSGPDDGGALWFSADGANWDVKYTLSGGTPREVLVFGGQRPRHFVGPVAGRVAARSGHRAIATDGVGRRD